MLAIHGHVLLSRIQRQHAFLNLVLMGDIFDLSSLVAFCVSLNRYTACLAQHIFLMRGGSSTVRLEMEHHNFDNETNEIQMRRLSGTCTDFVLCTMAAKHSTNHGEHMADH